MDLGYRVLAAKYIRRQAKQLAEQLDGVRAAEDIEFVHRARVATRRLRAALRMFDNCFAGARVQRWRKAIRRTTAKLGNARDRDVQIELLCGILSALDAKECFPGISRILVRLERDRESLQRKVVRAVDRLEAKDVLGDMQRRTSKMLRKALPAIEHVQTPTAFVQTEHHIIRQIDELLRHQDSLANPADRDRHHAMRIATKRLRYTLEIARAVYSGQLDEAVEAVKKVQSLLGDVHDCDIWADHLNVFASQERRRIMAVFGHVGRMVRLRPGIEYLRRDRRRHRQQVFAELVEYWAELGRRQFWDKLANMVRCHGQMPLSAAPQQRKDAGTSASLADDPPVASILPPEAAHSDCDNADQGLPGDGLDQVRQGAGKPLLTAGS